MKKYTIKEIKSLIKESLYEMDYELDDISMSDIDMPIKDKGVFSAMDNEKVEDDMSDIARYRRDKSSDYEGGFQDDVSVSPGYFNENETSTLNLDAISSEDIFKAANNPYGASMYFLTNYNNILNQREASELADNIGDNEFVVKYGINWEDDSMYTESGDIIPSAYGVETEFSTEELYEIIKEGVEVLHRKTLIENRLEQINNEFNALNNQGAWDEAKKKAKYQLSKNNIAWKENKKRDKLMSEGISEKNILTIKKLIDKFGHRDAAKKIIDSFLSSNLMGMTSEDLGDTYIFANGLDNVEEFLISGDIDNAFNSAKETAREMIEDEQSGIMFESNGLSDISFKDIKVPISKTKDTATKKSNKQWEDKKKTLFMR